MMPRFRDKKTKMSLRAHFFLSVILALVLSLSLEGAVPAGRRAVRFRPK